MASLQLNIDLTLSIIPVTNSMALTTVNAVENLTNIDKIKDKSPNIFKDSHFNLAHLQFEEADSFVIILLTI